MESASALQTNPQFLSPAIAHLDKTPSFNPDRRSSHQIGVRKKLLLKAGTDLRNRESRRDLNSKVSSSPKDRDSVAPPGNMSKRASHFRLSSKRASRKMSQQFQVNMTNSQGSMSMMDAISSISKLEQTSPQGIFGQSADKNDDGYLHEDQTMREKRQQVNNGYCEAGVFHIPIKKQMELKEGRVVSLIQDHPILPNKVNISRYRGLEGFFKIIKDCLCSIENTIATFIFLLIFIEGDSTAGISLAYPVLVVGFNFLFAMIVELDTEERLRREEDLVNSQPIDILQTAVGKSKRFFTRQWREVRSGDIIRVYEGEEFPADCLLLDIDGQAEQSYCMVTGHPNDLGKHGFCSKKAFRMTSSKTGKKVNPSRLADQLTGLVKYEFNYHAQIVGWIKLNDSPTSSKFYDENTVIRGQKLLHANSVVCLVLTIGDQTMNSIFHDPNYLDAIHKAEFYDGWKRAPKFFTAHLKSLVKRINLILLLILTLSGLILIYLESSQDLIQLPFFKEYVIGPESIWKRTQIAIEVFCLIFSVMPLSLTMSLKILGLVNMYFIDNDMHLAPADLHFLLPESSWMLSSIHHVFLSRKAIQPDEGQVVKAISVNGVAFFNEAYDGQWMHEKAVLIDKLSESDQGDEDDDEESDGNDYLPNQLPPPAPFENVSLSTILHKPHLELTKKFINLMRSVVLATDWYLAKDQSVLVTSYSERATLDIAKHFNFKPVMLNKKARVVSFQGKTQSFVDTGTALIFERNKYEINLKVVRPMAVGEQALLHGRATLDSILTAYSNSAFNLEWVKEEDAKFREAGMIGYLYFQRVVSDEEVDQLLKICDEASNELCKENENMRQFMFQLSQSGCQPVGILGVQKPTLFRNRVALDDLNMNGIKTWILASEAKCEIIANLNSMAIFSKAKSVIEINGESEKAVTDQLFAGIKGIVDKERHQDEDLLLRKESSVPPPVADEEKEDQGLQEKKILVVSGAALKEICRDQTLVKLFLSLSHLNDMIIGTCVSPIYKMIIMRHLKKYMNPGQFIAGVAASFTDHHLMSGGDISFNLESPHLSNDFSCVSEVNFRDFSALSGLILKHGSSIQRRVLFLIQSFIFRTVLMALVVLSQFVINGMSPQLDFPSNYFLFCLIVLFPLQSLVAAILHKEMGTEYDQRVFGLYKRSLTSNVLSFHNYQDEIITAILLWAVIYMPFQIVGEPVVSIEDGKILSNRAHEAYHVILLQITLVNRLRGTDVIIALREWLVFILAFIGILFIFEDGIDGFIQIGQCPQLLLQLVFQVAVMEVLRVGLLALRQVILAKESQISNWFQDIEKTLSFEDYEEPNQYFHIAQCRPLWEDIHFKYIKNMLHLINFNFLHCPSIEGLDHIQQLINKTLIGQIDDSNSGSTTNFVDSVRLQFSDLSLQSDYEKRKPLKELPLVQQMLLLFSVESIVFMLMGALLETDLGKQDPGFVYYLPVAAVTFAYYKFFHLLEGYKDRAAFVLMVLIVTSNTLYRAWVMGINPAELMIQTLFLVSLGYFNQLITIYIIICEFGLNIALSFIQSKQEVGLTYELRTMVARALLCFLWTRYLRAYEITVMNQFACQKQMVKQFQQQKRTMSLLVPALVRDKMREGRKNFYEHEGEVTIVFVDIHQFDDIVSMFEGRDLVKMLDDIYNTIDQLCEMHGVTKVETVGKTYMACAGLQSSEKQIDQKLLNKHHSVRVTDFALSLLKVLSQKRLKQGRPLLLKIGVHSGSVISGVVGEIKPQFSLIGDTVNKTSRVCSKSVPHKVFVSKETLGHLQTQANNYWYEKKIVFMKGIGEEPIFKVTLMGKKAPRAKQFQFTDEPKSKDKPSVSQNEDESQPEQTPSVADIEEEKEVMSDEDYDIQDDQATDRTVLNLPDSANVYGFNDDIKVSDLEILSRPSENLSYNLVERPRYLLSFENQETEREFWFAMFLREAGRTKALFLLQAFLNKAVIVMALGKFSIQPLASKLGVILLLLECVLFHQLNKLTESRLGRWVRLFQVHQVLMYITIATLRARYRDNFYMKQENELWIDCLLITLFATSPLPFWAFVQIYFFSFFLLVLFLMPLVNGGFSPKRLNFTIGHSFVLFSFFVFHYFREMNERKAFNYSRILKIEVARTKELIHKLVPLHALPAILAHEEHVDQFEDLTLLFTDMVGFTAFSKAVSEPQDVVMLLSKLFSRFDLLCQTNKVYKVHTIGDCYVVMGYAGRVSPKQRQFSEIVREAHAVVKTGLEMLSAIREVREEDENAKELDMRIGVHTGQVSAGIIGSKLVRYDIFGSGVQLANKMESCGRAGKVCVSEDTKFYLEKDPNWLSGFMMEPHQLIMDDFTKCEIQSFIIEPVLQASIDESRESFSLSELSNAQWNQK